MFSLYTHSLRHRGLFICKFILRSNFVRVWGTLESSLSQGPDKLQELPLASHTYQHIGLDGALSTHAAIRVHLFPPPPGSTGGALYLH